MVGIDACAHTEQEKRAANRAAAFCFRRDYSRDQWAVSERMRMP
jgi:hypothetical protein